MLEFVMLVGLPASGKSKIAESYREKGFHVHSSDDIRKELFGDERIQKDNTLVFRELYKRIKTDMEHKISCVCDATNLSRRRRKQYIDLAEKAGYFRTCVLCITPVDECIKRDRVRERTVGEDVIKRMAASFESPFYFEGWNVIEPVISDVEYDFPVEETKNFNQDNPYHSLTLYEHMKKTYENCLAAGANDDVQAAALMHDCGKLYTKTFRNMKGEITDTAHYYGHENYGSYIYLCDALCGKDKDMDFEVALYRANLINWHMKPLRGWAKQDADISTDKKVMSTQMYDDIMMLYEADIAAHG